MARLLDAHIAFDENRDDAAMTSLSRAMLLGRQGTFYSMHGWRPTVMTRLCARALDAGIEVDYVRALIRKRKLTADPSFGADVEAWPWPVRVYTLGRFEVVRDDKPLTFSHKVQRRPLALLKALIAFGGRDVREALLIDAVWPQAEGDAAQLALTTALHRLRALLGRSDAVTRQGGRIRLNPQIVWIDTWAVERVLERAEDAMRGPTSHDGAVNTAALLTDRAVAWHRGPFLAREVDARWAEPLQVRLTRRLLRQLVTEGNTLADHGLWEQAAGRYERAFALEPHTEDIVQALMGAYKQLGRTTQVDRVYTTFRDTLHARLGVGPGPETVALWRSLRVR